LHLVCLAGIMKAHVRRACAAALTLTDGRHPVAQPALARPLWRRPTVCGVGRSCMCSLNQQRGCRHLGSALHARNEHGLVVFFIVGQS
jgi:hypothetical protein